MEFKLFASPQNGEIIFARHEDTIRAALRNVTLTSADAFRTALLEGGVPPAELTVLLATTRQKMEQAMEQAAQGVMKKKPVLPGEILGIPFDESFSTSRAANRLLRVVGSPHRIGSGIIPSPTGKHAVYVQYGRIRKEVVTPSGDVIVFALGGSRVSTDAVLSSESVDSSGAAMIIEDRILSTVHALTKLSQTDSTPAGLKRLMKALMETATSVSAQSGGDPSHFLVELIADHFYYHQTAPIEEGESISPHALGLSAVRIDGNVFHILLELVTRCRAALNVMEKEPDPVRRNSLLLTAALFLAFDAYGAGEGGNTRVAVGMVGALILLNGITGSRDNVGIKSEQMVSTMTKAHAITAKFLRLKSAHFMVELRLIFGSDRFDERQRQIAEHLAAQGASVADRHRLETTLLTGEIINKTADGMKVDPRIRLLQQEYFDSYIATLLADPDLVGSYAGKFKEPATLFEELMKTLDVPVSKPSPSA